MHLRCKVSQSMWWEVAISWKEVPPLPHMAPGEGGRAYHYRISSVVTTEGCRYSVNRTLVQNQGRNHKSVLSWLNENGIVMICSTVSHHSNKTNYNRNACLSVVLVIVKVPKYFNRANVDSHKVKLSVLLAVYSYKRMGCLT